MAGVMETVVREFFEHLGFLVRQERKFVTPSRQEEEDGDFLVVHPQAESGRDGLPFVLDVGDVRRVGRAVIGLRGWHMEVLSRARLEAEPEVLRFVEAGAWRRVLEVLGAAPMPLRVLVVSGLPRVEAERLAVVELLRSRGVDAVLPVRTMLAELVAAVEPNRNYAKSDLFQMLRLLKRYGFLTLPQMELFGRRAVRRRS
ncbi:MAG: hypothetical protein NZM03_13500 [Limisphaera sp.]|nr:hypothetical protein [Limisphaera sp.]